METWGGSVLCICQEVASWWHRTPSVDLKGGSGEGGRGDAEVPGLRGKLMVLPSMVLQGTDFACSTSHTSMM